MFKFLKEKLSSAISKISEKISGKEKAEEEIKPEESKAEEQAAELPKQEEHAQEKEIESKEKAKHEHKISHEKHDRQKEEAGKAKEHKEKEKPAEIKKDSHKKEAPKAEIKEAKEIKRQIAYVEHEQKPKKAEETIKPKSAKHKEEIKESAEEERKIEAKAEPKEEKRGFFAKLKDSIASTVTTTKISEKEFEELFWELEVVLLENNAAVEIIDKIKNDLKEALVEKPIKRRNIEETIENALKDSIRGLFGNAGFDIIQEIRKKAEKPYVIVFFGINGSGKTTTIAKMAKMLKDNKLSCVIAAADTFRAASIEQLQIHGENLNVKVIKHGYGSDPAAVAFDAIKHAKAKNADVVLIDTAGRMHSNKNLMKEMEKIVRVAKPDLKIFVGESITGNDCVEQAKTFNDSLGIDGIILSKLDVDEKGGAAVSVSYITNKPILYFGVGQNYDDLKKFEADVVVRGLGLG